MYFKKIEIQGFKTFPDKTELEFNEGITCIVGPNGSGKSNIADAVRWVLGEQSIKSIRGNRLEEVIFAGTDNRKPLGFTQVSLTLDNTKKELPLDFTEITISRRFYRSGESEYFINKTPCRLKDIQELFMDTGLGKDAYSIVNQGQIDLVLSSRPEERREIFEEAAGISKFKYKKKETIRKLETTQQNLLRVQDIIEEISSNLEPLQIAARKAEKYKETITQLKDLEINLRANQIKKIRKKLEELNIHLQKIKQKIEEKDNLRKEIERSLSLRKQKLNNLEIEIEEGYREENSLEKEKDRSLGQIMICEERVRGINNQKKFQEEEIKSQDLKKKEIEILLLDLGQKEKEFQQRIASQNEELKKKEANLKIIEEEMEAQNKTIEEIKSELIEFIREKAKGNNILSVAEKDRERLEKEKNRKMSELKEKKLKSEDISQKMNSLQKLLERTKVELRNTEEELSQDVVKRDEKIKEQNVSKEAEDTYRQEYISHKSFFDLLSTMQDVTFFSSSGVKAVLSERDKDIKGVVTQFLKIKPGWEQAVELSLQDILQGIIVEEEKDILNLIQFLKNERKGIATFLPLNKFSAKTEEESKNQIPLSSLSDLIEASSPYSSIFQWLLKDVYITETLSEAQEWCLKLGEGKRIVTKEGELIRFPGIVSGGKQDQDINSLIQRRKRWEEEKKIVEELKAKLQELEDKRNKEEETLKEIELKITAGEEKIYRLKDEQENLARDIDWKNKEIENISSEILYIEEDIKHLSSEIEEKHCQAEEIKKRQKEQDVKEEETKQILEERLRELHQKELKLKECKNEIIGLKVDNAQNYQKYNNLKEQINTLNTRLEEINEQIETKNKIMQNLQKECINLQEEIKALQKKVSETDKQKQKLTEKLKLLRTQKEEMLSEINLEEEKILTIKDEQENLKENKHNLEIQIAKEETELREVSKRLIEEYEINIDSAIQRCEEIANYEEVESTVQRLRNRIKYLGTVNLGAIEEFKRQNERYQFLNSQKKDLEESIEVLRQTIREIDQKAKKAFLLSFQEIEKSFQEIFSQIFGGGSAQLILLDTENILESGVDIQVQLPGKRPQSLLLLSGGERSLVAIALLFAILKVKPSPFCVLDEIDAALDEANIERFTKLLEEFAKRTQFIIITHNRRTMEFADVLYGVTMEEEGISKVVSVRLQDREAIV